MSFIKSTFRRVLSFLSKSFLLCKSANLSIGTGSRVNYWRLRMGSGHSFSVGKDSLIRSDFVYERDGASVVIGDRTFIGRGLFTIAEKLSVGNDVLISWDVTIVDHNSHSIRFRERARDVELNAFRGIKDWTGIGISPVVIEDKAWIGFGVSILKGVTIGTGAVVGSKSVVTKSVEPWTIVGGNPAKLIRIIPHEDRI